MRASRRVPMAQTRLGVRRPVPAACVLAARSRVLTSFHALQLLSLRIFAETVDTFGFKTSADPFCSAGSAAVMH